jgi:hypothetical protein
MPRLRLTFLVAQFAQRLVDLFLHLPLTLGSLLAHLLLLAQDIQQEACNAATVPGLCLAAG